ncbi:hypothetical protein [Schumannella luteola]
MTRTRLTVVGTVLVAGALVALPSAASGHTDSLFTWGYTTGESSAFLTMSKADAALAPLAVLPDSVEHVSGVEVCGESAYALDDGSGTLLTWDHATGELLSSVPISDGYESFGDLDTLADCTILTTAWGESENSWVLLSLDAATGEATLEIALVQVTDPEGYYTGVATSPDGKTYTFGVADGGPFSSEVNVGTGIQEVPLYMAGLWGAADNGEMFTSGIDYDASGALWFVQGIDAEETLYLTVFAPGADINDSAGTRVGVIPYGAPAPFVDLRSTPLAADGAPAPSPQLAATGAETPAGALLAAVILALVGLLLVLRHRRTAH